MRNSPIHISDLLWGNDTIRKHLAHRQHELELLDRVLAQLPSAMRKHCSDARIKGTTLTVALDSPAWATRARFVAGDLIAALQDQGVTEVQTRVQPKATRPSEANKRPPIARMTAEAAAHLREAAEHMTDQTLANAIRRLARHQSKGAADIPPR